VHKPSQNHGRILWKRRVGLSKFFMSVLRSSMLVIEVLRQCWQTRQGFTLLMVEHHHAMPRPDCLLSTENMATSLCQCHQHSFQHWMHWQGGNKIALTQNTLPCSSALLSLKVYWHQSIQVHTIKSLCCLCGNTYCTAFAKGWWGSSSMNGWQHGETVVLFWGASIVCWWPRHASVAAC